MKRRKVISPVSPPATKPNRGARPIRRLWLPLGCLVLVAALGTAAVFEGRKHTFTRRMQTGLPVRPDLTGKPIELVQALQEAEAKARSSPTLREGIEDLGRLYQANGFQREAEICWQLLRAVQPNEARWCYYLADLRRATSDYSEMTTLLEETLKLAPDYSPARLQLANLQFKQGEISEAGRNYRLRLAQLPHDPYARLGLVRLALQLARKDEAKLLLEQLLQDAPNFATAHNLYSEILAAAGDEAGASQHRWLGVETLRYREAEDPWLEELQRFCFDYDRICVLGTIELQTEHHDQAQVFFERAIRLKPYEPSAYEMLGLLYLRRNEATRARDIFEQALTVLSPAKTAVIRINLSRTYRVLKQPAEALRVARDGLKQGDETPELLDTLGSALADSDQHEKAVEAFHAALLGSPNAAEINYNLAVSLLALRRLDETLAALDRSLTLQPTFPPTLLLRGQIEMAAEHWDQVERYLRPVFESHPENLQARQLLAEWHLHMGAAAQSKNDPANAERHFRQGVIVDRDNAELQLSRGVFYLARSRFSEAIEPLETHHRLQPDNAQGCLFLGQAYAASGQRDKARESFLQGAQLAERSGNTEAANYCREILRKL